MPRRKSTKPCRYITPNKSTNLSSNLEQDPLESIVDISNDYDAPISMNNRLKNDYQFASYAKEDHNRAIYDASFCMCCPKYENLFATVGSNRLTVYECLEDGDLDVIQSYTDSDEAEDYYTVAWTLDSLTGSPIICIAGLRGHIKIIDCISQSIRMVLSGHGNSVNEIKVHPVDPNLLVSASKDESVRLWNVITGVCIGIFAGHMGHRDEVLSVDVHLNGLCIVSSGMDNTIKVWELEADNIQEAIKKSYTEPKPENRPFDTKFIQFPSFNTSKVHSDYVDCVRFVGDMILSKSTANKMVLWKPNPLRGKESILLVKEFYYHDADIWFVKFGLDSTFEHFAVGNKQGRVYVFNIDDDSSDRSLCKIVHPYSKSTIREACFSKNGRHLIYCCDDSTVWRWDLKD